MPNLCDQCGEESEDLQKVVLKVGFDPDMEVSLCPDCRSMNRK
jgi:hypothetical protein